LDSSRLVGDDPQVAQPVAMMEIGAVAGVGGQTSKFLAKKRAIGSQNAYRRSVAS